VGGAAATPPLPDGCYDAVHRCLLAEHCQAYIRHLRRHHPEQMEAWRRTREVVPPEWELYRSPYRSRVSTLELSRALRIARLAVF